MLRDWLDRLPGARIHRETRALADATGLSYWRDWHHAMAYCCGAPAWRLVSDRERPAGTEGAVREAETGKRDDAEKLRAQLEKVKAWWGMVKADQVYMGRSGSLAVAHIDEALQGISDASHYERLLADLVSRFAAERAVRRLVDHVVASHVSCHRGVCVTCALILALRRAAAPDPREEPR